MLRVLIVDDENWVRRGIIEKARWGTLGAEVVAEACHGLEGLGKAREYKPDIVITDMRMPVMDGVEFISHLHREFPETSVIVISGYSDYEYTRQALLNKVADYILKPIKKDDLNNVLTRIIEEHMRSRKEKMDVDAMRENIHSNISLVRAMELNRLIDGDIQRLEINAGIMEPLGISSKFRYLSAAVVMICNFRTVSNNKFDGNDERLSNAILDVMGKAGDKNDCMSFRKNGYKHIYVLLCGECEEGSGFYKKNKVIRIVKKIEKGLYDHFGAVVKAGTGLWYQGLTNVQISYREAAQALNMLNILSNDTVLHVEDIRKTSEEFSCEDYLNILIKLILYGDEVNIQKQIRRINEKIISNGNINFKDLYKLRSKFLGGLEEELKKTGAGSGNLLGEEPFDKAKDSWTYTSLGENMDWLYKVAASAAAGMRLNSAASAKQTVNKVIEYIQSHYAEKILLATISEKFYISETYFCRVFKKETGNNFIDYLTDVRMKKAKEMFDHYSMKVYEVAELVGYKDVRYFSKLYKKHFPV